MALSSHSQALPASQIKAFKSDTLLKSFYKFIHDHHLRREAFNLVHKQIILESQNDLDQTEQVASYNDVVESDPV